MSSGDPATDGIDFDREAAPEEVLAETGAESIAAIAGGGEEAAASAATDAPAFEGFLADVDVDRGRDPEDDGEEILEDVTAEALFDG